MTSASFSILNSKNDTPKLSEILRDFHFLEDGCLREMFFITDEVVFLNKVDFRFSNEKIGIIQSSR